MTREDAIKILENMSIPPMDDYSFNDISDALYMAVKALQLPPITQRSMYQKGYKQGREEALKDKLKSGWISCTESMPNDGKWAIWCSSDGAIGIARFKEDCYNHFYPNKTSFDLEDAVAWMPLPEPFCSVDMRGEDE